MTLSKREIKRLSILLLVLALGLILFFVFRNAFSKEGKSDTIVFYGNKNIAPIVYKEKGKVKGVVVDIVNELGKRIGYKVEVKALDWDEAQSKVLQGEGRALVQINPNPERLQVFDFSDELLRSEFSIFTKVGNATIKNVADLTDKKVGVEKKGYPYELLHKFDGIKIEVIPNWKTGFEMLVSGKLDAVVVDRWIGEYELAKSKIRDVQILDEPIETQYSRIATKKGDIELLSLINAGLREINDDGTMDAIVSRWKGKRVIYLTEEKVRWVVLHTAVGVLGFVLLVSLFWIKKLQKLGKGLEVEVKQRTHELDEANALLRAANAELERISMVDELTEISNRRGFDLAFQESWEISKKDKRPLALVMIDIDDFKKYNDTYGHLAGDRCLKCVAEEIKKIVGMRDQVTRFGGEEFLIILDNTIEDEAAIIADKIRKRIEELTVNDADIESPITISLGVAAVIPNDSLCSDDLVNAADKALYKAKRDGKNQVATSSSVKNDPFQIA